MVYFCRERRVILRALFLSFVLIGSTSLLVAQFGGGSGTENDPWHIGRPDHLHNIRDYLGAQHSNKHFIQTHDIDMDVAPWNEDNGWLPIGDAGDDGGNRFHGHFDGDGYVISNLMMNRNISYTGLFGYISGATIKNLALEDVDFRGGGYRSGTVSGLAENSTIENTYVTGSVSVNGSQTAGFIGAAWACNITDSWADIEYTTANSWDGIFIGTCYGNTTVRNCFTLGSFTQTAESRQNLGAFIGMLTSATVENSYSRATINVPAESNRVGSFIGRNLNGTITNCYATGRLTAGEGSNTGGLTGDNGGGCETSYWDTETTGQDESANGDGRLTRQMVYPYDEATTYVRWDFEEIWQHDPQGTHNDGYPALHFEEVIPPDMLDTPEPVIEIRTIDDAESVYISWEAIEDAGSYLIFSADDPYTEEWGDHIAAVEETEFSEELHEDGMRYYRIVAISADRSSRRSQRVRPERTEVSPAFYDRYEYDEANYDIYGKKIE